MDESENVFPMDIITDLAARPWKSHLVPIQARSEPSFCDPKNTVPLTSSKSRSTG